MDVNTHGEKTGIFAKKGMWIGIGVGIFILVAFILPTPQSLIDVMEKYGYVQKMIDWEIAHDVEGAAAKTMIVLGIVPMAVIFFAVEALPIGVTGILMPIMAYFFGLLPFNMIGKTFAGDAPLFTPGRLVAGMDQGVLGSHDRVVLQHVHRGFVYVGPWYGFIYGAGYDGRLLRVGEGQQPGGKGDSRSGSGQISAFFPLLLPEYGRARNPLGRGT